MLNDLRHAARLLWKNRASTLIAVLALGLGLGANAAMFVYVNALILHPFPFPEQDRIVNVWETQSRTRAQREAVSPSNFLDWRTQAHSFRYLAGYRGWDASLTGVDDPERIQAYAVSPEFFPLLGLSPQLGRTFSPDEAEPGQDAVVVLSYGFWQRRFASSPAVVGRSVSLDGRSYTVVGVMPKDFDFPLATDVWAPLAFSAQERAERSARSLRIIGRLAPGVEVQSARQEMTAISGRLERQYPQANQGRTAQLATIREGVNPVTDRFVMVLMSAAGFLLLLACANVANINLARTCVRARETAVRTALGASRWRVARQLFIESLLLSLAGGILGVVFAAWNNDVTRATIPPFVYRVVAGMNYVRIDATVVGFVVASALFTGLLCGLGSALHASSARNLNERLRAGGRGAAGAERHRLRNVLVASEVALATVLLVGGGLMVQTFRHIAKANLGYNPKNVLTFRIALQESRYRDAGEVHSFFDDLPKRLSALPAVRTAALDGGWTDAADLTIEGQPARESSESTPLINPVSSGYFRAMELPILRGRPIEGQDGPDSVGVAVISETTARHYWKSGADPVGSRIRVGGAQSGWLTVIGVAGDQKDWFANRPIPIIYTAFAQSRSRGALVLVRTGGDPLACARAVRAEMQALDRNQPIYDLRTMEQHLADQMSGVQTAARMMSGFAVFALLLAATGTFAVISYMVSQRTHEIGIRIAVGADRNEVLRLVVGQALRLAAIGLAIGGPLAYLLSRLMSSAVYGVVALDWRVFAGFALLIAAAAFVAGYFPARRAASVDPIAALRCE